MRALKAQYLFCFAVVGSIQVLLPVLLEERGLSRSKIGGVMAAASLAIVLTPALIALLADTVFSGRRLLALAFLLSGGALAALWFAHDLLSITLLFSTFSLTMSPVPPLQDGLNFAEQQHRRDAGLPAVPYHRVRVWGSIGYILPGIALYGLLTWGMHSDVAVTTAIVLCALGLINTFALPDRRVNRSLEERSAGLPTLQAWRAMREPHVLTYCIAMFIAQMAISVYYLAYPLYLPRLGELSKASVPPIMNLGVFVEIFYMLGFGYLFRRFGLRRALLVGMVLTSLRFALLAAFPSVFVAISTQVLHGAMVMVIHVMPPIYLNSRAGDAYRNSMQGLYVMAVAGPGRIAGNLVAGYVADRGLELAFAYGAGMALVAAALLWVAFHDHRHVEA